MDIFERLRTSGDLTENDRAISGYVLDHIEEVSRLTARDLARRTYTSPSAVMRFCRRLGFESFNDFKVNFASDLKRANPGDTSIGEHEPALSACSKIAALESFALAEMARTVDTSQIQRIADLLLDHPYVDFVARDANVTLADYASHNLILARHLVTVYSNVDRMMLFALETPADHVVFLISRGGLDAAMIQTARSLHERGVTTVAITSAPDSTMASLCDYVVGCYFISNKQLGDISLSLACSYVFGDMVFSLSCKYVFDVLFVMLFSDDVASNRRLTDEYHRLYTTGIGATLAEEIDTTSQVLPGVGFIGRDSVPN